MRTTVNLDDDIYELASVYASARGITLGSALGELVRTSGNPLSGSVSTAIPIGTNGLPLLPSRGRKLTPEMVKAASEDELTENKYLLDLNVLIALADVDHSHHIAALRWFDGSDHNWGTCVLTEAGFIRVMANPRAGGYDVAKATEILSLLTAHPRHRFWPVADGWNALTTPFAERLFGHQQMTDACLLGLAVREDGILVTMDKAIRYMAGAKYARNVMLLDAG